MLVQPIEFKTENVNQQFKKVHNVDLIQDCMNFIKEDERDRFKKLLSKNPRSEIKVQALYHLYKTYIYIR